MTRAVWLLAAASIGLALLMTLWFVTATIAVRVPYWGEAEVLFEASRLREHLPLYVDPLVGAHEYGEPPSRFYVTYPPLWSWVVSAVPKSSATLAARLACTLAWFGSLAAIAATTRREARVEAVAAAAFVGGIWVLANFATVGRPDSIACSVAAYALVRAMRKGRVDGIGAALLVLVPWVKPTLIGLPLGVLAGAVLVDRARAWRTIGAAAVVAGLSVAIAERSSNGALFVHVVRSNAQPFALDAWLEQVPSRLPFFGPLVAWAAWVAWRDQANPGTRIGLAALGSAVVWTLFALAKTGSSSNYWMEPCIAAVVLVARTPRRRGAPDGYDHPTVRSPVQALTVLAAVVWADTASVRAAIEHARTERANAAFVASVRERCGAPPPAIIAADEAGIELVANGRILTPTYQMVHLVRRAEFPGARWLEDRASATPLDLSAALQQDLASPFTRCFVEHSGQLRLAPALERALENEYVAMPDDGSATGFRLWKRR